MTSQDNNDERQIWEAEYNSDTIKFGMHADASYEYEYVRISSRFIAHGLTGPDDEPFTAESQVTVTIKELRNIVAAYDASDWRSA